MSKTNLPFMTQSYGEAKFDGNKTGDKINFSIKFDISSGAKKIGVGLYKKAEGTERDKDGFAVMVDFKTCEVLNFFDNMACIGWFESISSGKTTLSFEIQRNGGVLAPTFRIGDDEMMYPDTQITPAQNLIGLEYEIKVSFPLKYEADKLFSNPVFGYEPGIEQGRSKF